MQAEYEALQRRTLFWKWVAWAGMAKYDQFLSSWFGKFWARAFVGSFLCYHRCWKWLSRYAQQDTSRSSFSDDVQKAAPWKTKEIMISIKFKESFYQATHFLKITLQSHDFFFSKFSPWGSCWASLCFTMCALWGYLRLWLEESLEATHRNSFSKRTWTRWRCIMENLGICWALLCICFDLCYSNYGLIWIEWFELTGSVLEGLCVFIFGAGILLCYLMWFPRLLAQFHALSFKLCWIVLSHARNQIPFPTVFLPSRKSEQKWTGETGKGRRHWWSLQVMAMCPLIFLILILMFECFSLPMLQLLIPFLSFFGQTCIKNHSPTVIS